MNAKIQGELNVKFGISNSIVPYWSLRQKEKISNTDSVDHELLHSFLYFYKY